VQLAGMTERYDVITMGRVGVDLYPEQIGVGLADVQTFAKFLGGSATNVAVAAARLGARAAVITKVGDDPFGPYVRRALEGFGVDPRWVGTHPTLRTPIVFCEIHPPDDFPLLFYREPTAPDMTLEAGELDLGAIRDARVFWTTGTGLSAEPSRTATLTALRARDEAGAPAITIHDLDHRPMFWPAHTTDPGEAGRWAREALRHATVAVGNRDEVEVAVGTRDPHEASAALLDLGVELAIVKQGPAGVLARTADRVVEVPPVTHLGVVNGLGAGDAFGGALVHALLAGWEFERAIRLANAAGAFVAAQLACADAMPTIDQLAPLVGEGWAAGGGPGDSERGAGRPAEVTP
jgi:5-dehydro-2-deoxygluconokinase